MAATPAYYSSTQMTALKANAGGGIMSLLDTMRSGGRERIKIADIVLASQTYASNNVIALARFPVPFVLTGIVMLTDTSLGSSTVALGNAADTKSAIYKAAGTFTSTNTPTQVGLAATMGVPILEGVDAYTGETSSYSAAHNGGALYEDICATIGAADLPASGNLRFIFRYVID